MSRTSAPLERIVRVGHQFHRDGEVQVVVGLHLVAIAVVAKPDAADIRVLVEAHNVVAFIEELLDSRESTRTRSDDTDLHETSDIPHQDQRTPQKY